MTNNLINIILATCLLFGSLNLAAGQISTSSHKAEAQFLAGEACLKQVNTGCAMAALAQIPSSSPYAKLLQGEIAYHNQALDQALQLLLPLQSDNTLMTVAKVSLHQYLANAFVQLQDTEQALIHLLQVDIALSKTSLSLQKDATALNHAQIWTLLNKLNQGELLSIRGNNTDDHFQGWVDLALATKHQDLNNSLKTWQISYQDHPASAFSNTLLVQKTEQTLKLPSTDDITITYKPTSDADSARAEAFKLGLQTALSLHGLTNNIHIHSPTNDAPKNDVTENTEQNLPSINTETQIENPYFITLQFNQGTDETDSIKDQASTHQALTLGLHLHDEAEQLVKFAANNAISHVAILTTEDETSAELLSHFSIAWQKAFNLNEDHNAFNIITLPQNLTASDPSLLDVQTKINAKAHDMVLLAVPAANARIIRPYLNVGTPAVAFSNLHEASPDHALNAVRFVEIPFLLSSNTEFSTHKNATTQPISNDLLRWYALGVDALPILIATQQSSEKEVILNGLTGKINIHHGKIMRQPSMGRFTYEGISKER
jgi:hypothetical protein